MANRPNVRGGANVQLVSDFIDGQSNSYGKNPEAGSRLTYVSSCGSVLLFGVFGLLRVVLGRARKPAHTFQKLRYLQAHQLVDRAQAHQNQLNAFVRS